MLLSRGRFGRSEMIALALGAVALAAGIAAWVGADADQAPLAAAAIPAVPASTFEARFGQMMPASAAAYPATDAVQALDRFASRSMNRELLNAWAALVRGMQVRDSTVDLAASDWRPTLVEGTTVAMPAPGIPLPRPRPAGADQTASITPSVLQTDTTRVEDRSLFDKLSDLLPSRIHLASLTPDDGTIRTTVDLGALGYDRQTAVYDITAKVLYLPSGVGLETHSGMGDLKDDPDHVSQRMVGATPPATYELKPREKLFHGVRALRMTAIEGSALGRTGLLTHPFMLGPGGDSNGCVSIKNYDRFLKAYDTGEVTKLAVVTRLESAATKTAQQKTQSEL